METDRRKEEGILLRQGDTLAAGRKVGSHNHHRHNSCRLRPLNDLLTIPVKFRPRNMTVRVD
jgi:hypothetical protein